MALGPNDPANAVDKQAREQDVLLREVDDALREEELIDNIKRHGKSIGLAVLLGLAGFGGYLWWQNQKEDATGANSVRFAAALDRIEAGQLDAGFKELTPLQSDTSGSGAAARLMQAGILQEQGKGEEAARRFAAIAADSGVPQPFRDLALLRETSIRFDKLQPQQVVDRLKDLAVAGKPWFGTAGELTAMAYVRMGQNAKAGPLFAAIAKDKNVPESLRSRARQMAGMLGFDAIDDVARAAGVEDESGWAPQPRAPQASPPQGPPPQAQPAPAAPPRQ